MLFDKFSTASSELHTLLGFIAADTNFNKWRTWIDLSVRQITAITGKELYTLAHNHYQSDNYLADAEPVPAVNPTYKQLDTLVKHFQLANALFAYVKLLPSLDAGHSNNGRTRSVGDTERSLTAVEAYKDESNILSLAYEAMEALIDFAEETKFTAWLTSTNRKFASGLFVSSPEIFNRYYTLSSARMYYTLTPMMAEVERIQIRTCVSSAVLTEIKEALAADEPNDRQKLLVEKVENTIRPVIVFSTLAMALERLPIEIFPDGIFQTQIVGTVKEKQAATDQTRQALIASFSNQADSYLTMLQDDAQLLSGTPPADIYISVPKEVPNGFRF